MKAVHDCNRSLCLDNSAKVKVQWRRSRAYKQLGMLYPAWLDMKSVEPHACSSVDVYICYVGACVCACSSASHPNI